MFKKINTVLTWVENTLLILGILTPIAIIGINVILRNFFTNAIVWAEEYARFCIIGITFIGLGVAVREKAHMRITAVYDSLNPKYKYIMDLFVNGASLCIGIFLFYEGMRTTLKIALSGQISSSLALPMWVLYATVPLGCIMLVIRLIQCTADIVKKHREEMIR